MSALSEVDLRDFKKIDVDLLEKALRQENIYFPDHLVKEYCNTIMRMQKTLIQQTPALFKPKA